MIPKCLECIQKVGIDTISRSLVSGREDSFTPNNIQSQNVNYIPPYQQPVTTTYNSPVYVSSVSPYVGPQVGQGNIPVYQNVYPTQVVQPVKHTQFVPPVQQIGASGVRGSQVNIPPVVVQSQIPVEQRFAQSHVQTVRPVQPIFVRPP